MRTLLIANRGEIARRIMRTARRMGLRTVAVYSDADRDAPHVRDADTAVRLGRARARESYLNIAAIVVAAKRADTDAVHPGYGFLAENAAFAQAVIDAGLTWVGPPAAVIRAMGDKAQAKRIARKANVPTLAGAEPEDQTSAGLIAAAQALGFPLMIKAAAGGGGRGMRRVANASELAAALEAARSEAQHAFGDGRLLIERALDGARHIEVQVFADQHGNVVHLGERDCSVQRRHQKLIEEQPSPAVDAALRAKLGDAAVTLARAVSYVGAGTVEFLLDRDKQFYFMEMNTRLQVEHPVTEMITGADLVEWQIRVARGEAFTRAQADLRFRGHAIEARLCAEDPAQNFLPQAGRVALWRPDQTVRVEHALAAGAEVSPHYDSMIAKVIAHGATREEARLRLARALDNTVVLGLPTNKAFLSAVLRDEEFATQGATTELVERRLPSIKPRKADAETLAIAAALLAAKSGHGAWSAWSNNPARSMRAKLDETDIVLRQRDGAYHARVGDTEVVLRIASLAPPDARISLNGVDRTVTFVIDDRLHLARDGESYSFENTLHAPAARTAQAGDGRLVAPMNGRVVAVNAKAGDAISAGSALVVLEAMKMEHALSVAHDAQVKAVHVAAGAQVAPGQLLAELEAVS
ncbi:MAG TPA: biotin carboxylase N-terminal domain-containing protein [Xanthobacteraceae bacterium]|nr:biotin carboxylase N-terminal domain-containing protein [Xanthobacteraceae bacterium]